MLRDVLVPALEAAFPDQPMRLSDPPQPIATFPGACPEVGCVQVFDDGDEATVVIENVTHHHVDCYDQALSESARFRRMATDVVEFLRELFADRVLLWSRDQGRGGGGWQRTFEGEIPKNVPEDADTFVWSRRLARSD